MSILEPYWGEFLTSPIPLELSLNYCSHKCAYCFANLNDPRRHGDVKKIMRFLADFRQRDTLSARLLQMGYPVVVSNRSDPFSISNYRQMMPILEVMAEIGIPVTFQTKGGIGWERSLELFPRSVWYISISFWNDDIRKRIEPGAPSIQERLKMIQAITNAGARVILGLNPVVPEWIPDPEPLIEAASQAGAEGAWIEELHLNAAQVRNMSAQEKAAIGPDILARSQKRYRPEQDAEAFFNARRLALEYGLEIYSNGQPNPSNIWQIYRQTYEKTFPTNQDFVNVAHALGLQDRLIAFEGWLQTVSQGLPKERFRMNKYIGASARSIFDEYQVPSKLTFEELLSVIWTIRRARQSPVRMPCFSYAAVMGQDGILELLDENRRPYLVFDPEGRFTEYYTPVIQIPTQEEIEAEIETAEVD